MADGPAVARLAAHLREATPAMLDDLRLLVEHESPTGDAGRLDALAETTAARWAELGSTVRRHHREGVGTHLEVHWPADPRDGSDARPALLLGHIDTVHAVGTLARNPFRVEAGRAYGPGSQDMKAGIVLALHAVRALGELGVRPARPLVVLLTADEEAGSRDSRPLIEDVAAGCAHALVLEAAGPGASLKTARKGIANYTLTVTGQAAHAGQDFPRGINANVALARLAVAAHELSDPQSGTTVNVGVVAGGTRPNVVAERARAELDVRFWDDAEARRVERALRGLRVAAGAHLAVDGAVNRPAFRRTPAVGPLVRAARRVAAALGDDLDETSVGGGSDGNLTAALGLPTLDGLGAVGAGLHTADEYVEVASLPNRAALLAGLLASL